MKTSHMVAAAALVVLAACSKTEYSAGEVDTADTSNGSLDVGITTDTINVPTLGIEKDTVVVSKPVISGSKPVEVARPTVDVKKP